MFGLFLKLTTLFRISSTVFVIFYFTKPTYALITLTNVKYPELNSSSNYPITETMTFNETMCNFGELPKKVFFPIPFLIGSGQCWNLTSVDPESIIVSASYPKITYDQVENKLVWNLKNYGRSIFYLYANLFFMLPKFDVIRLFQNCIYNAVIW